MDQYLWISILVRKSALLQGWNMNDLLRSLAAAASVAILALSAQPSPRLARAQSQPSQAPAAAGPETKATQDSPETARPDPTLVTLNVLVTDEDGRVLTNLKRGNFRVLDSGSPQPILSFEPTKAPITLVMLLEYSAATYGYFADKSAEWGSRFLDHLEPTDWVALVTFDLNSKVQVDFTHKRFEVRDTLTTLGYPKFSETNLFDSLIDTLDMLDRVKGRKSILLMATGINSFSAANLDEVTRRLQKTDATIFCVGLAEAEATQSGGSNLAYVQAKNQMSAFARQTGGIAIFPRFEGELPGIFRSVVGYLRSEYTLTFRPPKEYRDGRYHRLKVDIVGPEGQPLKATDEKGKQRKIEVFTREGYTAMKEKTP
ncbi:MAG: VWA domain-containing protein [Acidobacteriota bacterium]